MKKKPVAVRVSRIRRQITYLKAVLRSNGIALPPYLTVLLAKELPKRMGPFDRKRLQLLRCQERELRVLRDRTCQPINANHTPATERKPANARFVGGGLPSLGRKA
jgi:hypothetical protein